MAGTDPDPSSYSCETQSFDVFPSGEERQCYDVFIGHRGPDTKTKLVSVLHRYLSDKGFRCFVDYKMDLGDHVWPCIRSAIGNSPVHVVVISADFASSKWCLRELYEIMQLRSPSLATHILPIFYKVKVSDLRRQIPGSDFDLSRLERVSEMERSDWSGALIAIADIKGIKFDGDGMFEGDLIGHVVDRIMELLQSSTSLFVANHWYDDFALELDEAKAFLKNNSSDSKVVSMGITGVHASYFAKALYNELQKEFSASCILLNVSKENENILRLQSKLLKDLVMVDKAIHYPEEGRQLLLSYLKNIKCFIVLDDIGAEKDQLENLLVIDKDQLGEGSRLIFTSCYPHILKERARVDRLWHLTGLESEFLMGRGHLDVFCEQEDVNASLISYLLEYFSMLGLTVSELKEFRRQFPRHTTIFVISPQSLGRARSLLRLLNESESGEDTKVVFLCYGLNDEAKGSFLKEDLFELVARSAAPTEIGKHALRSFPERAVCYAMDLHRWTESGEGACAGFHSIITDVVQSFLGHPFQVSVTEYPVGLRKRQRELESLVDRCTSVGVWGVQGVGKSTLVKSLYNKICSKFERSVFLHDVGNEEKSKDTVHWQKVILNQLLRRDVAVNSVPEGEALLSQKLFGIKALVILDGVDDELQVKALYNPMRLGPGSRMLITSRCPEVLRAARADETYKVECLDPASAKSLFGWHAFLHPCPSFKGVEDVSQKVISACNGLPHTLTFVGDQLYQQKDPRFWKAALLSIHPSDGMFDGMLDKFKSWKEDLHAVLHQEPDMMHLKDYLRSFKSASLKDFSLKSAKARRQTSSHSPNQKSSDENSNSKHSSTHRQASC